MAVTDNYLPCESYQSAPDSEQYPGFKGWADADSGQWYFAVVTNTGRVVLRSEAYTSESGRNNGIESVMRNRDIEERYSVEQGDDGQWYVVLKAGNHQEIARSCPYGSEADAKAGIAACFSTYTERSAANVDEYMDCAHYANQPASEKYPGFTTFTNEETGEHYFAMVDKKGNVLLRSEGYTKEASRDNGIESVMRNRDIEERYSVEQGANDQYYVVLKAGNRQEIARSCGCDSEEVAASMLSACMKASSAGRNAANADEYMDCAHYANQPAAEKYPGFTTFTNEETGEHYFAMVDKKGHVLLRSEGYVKEASRDNGIESVMRNRDIEERYSVEAGDDGQWYVVLKAGNRQEIARSCGYDSEGAAVAAIGACMAVSSQRSAASVDEYMECAQYANQPASEKYPGFTTFANEETGEHYFAMVDGHGDVVLRSEGYTSASSRDNGIESVLRNRDIEERYAVVQNEADGLWYVALRAGNHQEIARSCGFADQGAANAHLMHCYSRKHLEEIATGADQIIEDYLPCKAYEGHPAAPDYAGFTAFQAEDSKLHYFAMIDDDDKVALKSEGYKDPTRRDNGIESVIRNRGIAEHWKEMEDEHGHYMSLRAVNHQEIARSCHYKDKAAMLAWITPFLAGHTSWAGDAEPEETAAAPLAAAAIAAAPEVIKRVVTTDTPDAAPIAAYASNAATDADAGGGMGWLKWLLPLLLLLGLLWFLMRGCDGCGKKAEVAPPPPPATTSAAPAATTPAPAAAPAAAPAPTCKCSGNSDPLFNMGTGTPKALHRLGTNPEFGNSHDLSPAQFYEKLAARAKSNADDKRFLDRVFKGIGYANGFADAKADQFSNVTFEPGTVGNIGYSKAHKTLYARLDTEGKDLMAFKIKGANGCDFHFMKTCGNHFFTCPN